MTSEAPAYTSNDVVTGMCLWEAFLNLAAGPDEGQEVSAEEAELQEEAENLLSDEGAFTMRNALVRLVAPCMEGWNDFRSGEPDGSEQFDWEWCPKFVRATMQDGSLEAAIAAEYRAD